MKHSMIALAGMVIGLAILALTGFVQASGDLTPRPALPGRAALNPSWRVVGIVVEDETGNQIVIPLATMLETPTPTSTPTPTHTPRATDAPRMTPTETPSAPPTDSPTPTLENACVVRSTANVNARTLPVVRSDTGIGVLPADSPVHITGYTVEQISATVSYIWYRYWFDVDHPEAWSRADFFTERDESPGCQLLPRVTES